MSHEQHQHAPCVICGMPGRLCRQCGRAYCGRHHDNKRYNAFPDETILCGACEQTLYGAYQHTDPRTRRGAPNKRGTR